GPTRRVSRISQFLSSQQVRLCSGAKAAPTMGGPRYTGRQPDKRGEKVYIPSAAAGQLNSDRGGLVSPKFLGRGIKAWPRRDPGKRVDKTCALETVAGRVLL